MIPPCCTPSVPIAERWMQHARTFMLLAWKPVVNVLHTVNVFTAKETRVQLVLDVSVQMGVIKPS